MHQAVINMLTEVAGNFKLLEMEANERHAAGDIDGYQAKLRRRAELIRDLPEQIGPLLERDEESIQLLTRLQGLASSAREVLEERSYFGMGTLLTGRGTFNNDLNALERLIAAFEGTRSETEPDWRSLLERLCDEDPMTHSNEGLDDGCFFCGADVVCGGELPQPHYSGCTWIEAMDALGREHPEHVIDDSRLRVLRPEGESNGS